MTPQIRIAGQPLALTAAVGDLVVSHEFPAGGEAGGGIGGPVSAQCTVLLPRRERPAWLTDRDTAGRMVRAEVTYGGLRLLAGTLTEPDWGEPGEPVTLTVDGAAREGAGVPCLTAGGMSTSTPNTAVDAAIARGALTWTRPASISTTALTDGDETAKLNSISDMLAVYAQSATAVRLIVDAGRRLLKVADPVTPEVFILPGTGELGWTGAAQATRLIGRWANASEQLVTTMVGVGETERLVDLTPLGKINQSRATTVLTNILAKLTGAGWTGGITVTRPQLWGQPDLAEVADRVGRGLMIRLHGQNDPRPGRPPTGYIDFIPERSEWHVATGQLVLTPRGMVARDFAAVLAESGVTEAAL